MTKTRSLTLGLILLTSFATMAVAQTQQPTDTPVAPVPATFVNAKRVFIANGAGDNDPGITKYTNGPDGMYNQFYADVKALGRFELVGSPGEAEVVLELRIDYALFNHDFTYPKFRLEVRDSKTNVLLWTFTEPVQGALLAKTGRKNVAQALAKLTEDLTKLLPIP